MTYRALFSCWDADPQHMTSWVSDGRGYCERFGGEGTGSHCIIPVTLVQGTTYAVSVRRVSSNASGAAWQGDITDVAANTTTRIGTLWYPSVPGYEGYGAMQRESALFLEWFEADNCAEETVAGAGQSGPRMLLADGTSVLPVQATPDYAAGCDFSDVTACIPGLGCGAHHVYQTGGGTTKRTNAAGVPLW